MGCACCGGRKPFKPASVKSPLTPQRVQIPRRTRPQYRNGRYVVNPPEPEPELPPPPVDEGSNGDS